MATPTNDLARLWVVCALPGDSEEFRFTCRPRNPLRRFRAWLTRRSWARKETH